MINKTLTETLKRFDEGIAKDIHDAERVQIWDAGEHGGVDLEEELVGRTRQFLVESIKDALEACRVSGYAVREGQKEERLWLEGWIRNTTQYDENVKSFLGEK